MIGSTFPMMRTFRKLIPSAPTLLAVNFSCISSQEKMVVRPQPRSQPSKRSLTLSARSRSQRFKLIAQPSKIPSKKLSKTPRSQILSHLILSQIPRSQEKAKSMECQRRSSKSSSKKSLRSKLSKCFKTCQRLLKIPRSKMEKLSIKR